MIETVEQRKIRAELVVGMGSMWQEMGAQRIPLGRGDVSTHLEGSGVLAKQINLGKSVTDRGNSQSEGPEAGVCQNVQGTARGPRGLVWRGHREGQ